MTTNTPNQLQTPASQAAEELAAGHGGSYTLDPQSGAVTLTERTEFARAGSKHPDAPQNLPAATSGSTDEPAAPTDSFAG